MGTNQWKPEAKGALLRCKYNQTVQARDLTNQQVFGTLVDWHSTVTNYLSTKSSETLNSPSFSLSSHVRRACAGISWADFAQQWRTSYYEAMSAQAERKNKGEELAFKTVDGHHHDSLRKLLSQYDISGLWTDEEVLEKSCKMYYLDRWLDSSKGPQTLKNEGLIITTLSNSSLSLLQDMATHAKLPGTHVFSAEKFGAHKRNPSVYTGVCRELDLALGQCAMAAAHLGDLQATKESGFQTIYIERPGEESWWLEKVREAKGMGWIDIWVAIDEKLDGGGILVVVKQFKTPASAMHSAGLLAKSSVLGVSSTHYLSDLTHSVPSWLQFRQTESLFFLDKEVAIP
jgi:2-haloacid dehalogenase